MAGLVPISGEMLRFGAKSAAMPHLRLIRLPGILTGINPMA